MSMLCFLYGARTKKCVSLHVVCGQAHWEPGPIISLCDESVLAVSIFITHQNVISISSWKLFPRLPVAACWQHPAAQWQHVIIHKVTFHTKNNL